MKFSCCNPKKQDCSRPTVQQAVEHAEQRGKATGKTQICKFKDDVWVISKDK
jgi:hypothetical protein